MIANIWEPHYLAARQGAKLLSPFKMAAQNVEFWPFLERNFWTIGCTLEDKTTVSNLT